MHKKRPSSHPLAHNQRRRNLSRHRRRRHLSLKHRQREVQRMQDIEPHEPDSNPDSSPKPPS